MKKKIGQEDVDSNHEFYKSNIYKLYMKYDFYKIKKK